MSRQLRTPVRFSPSDNDKQEQKNKKESKAEKSAREAKEAKEAEAAKALKDAKKKAKKAEAKLLLRTKTRKLIKTATSQATQNKGKINGN